MRNLIVLSLVSTILLISLISADYTPQTYNAMNITLKSGITAQTYNTINITLGVSLESMCSPTSGQDWFITDAQICNQTKISIGAGNIIVTNGTLTLIEGATISAHSLMINQSGNKVFINNGSKLYLG